LQPARLFEGQLAGIRPILGESNVIRLQDQRGFAETVAAIMEGPPGREMLLSIIRGCLFNSLTLRGAKNRPGNAFPAQGRQWPSVIASAA
jgi:hypothetical protein